MSRRPLIKFEIPCLPDSRKGVDQPPIQLPAGEFLFLVGPNGAGKSSLLQYIYTQSKSKKKKIIRSYRKNSIRDEDSWSILGRDRDEMIYQKVQAEASSRYADRHGEYVVYGALLNLIDDENTLARKAVTAIVNNERNLEKRFGEASRPVSKINRVLASGMPEIKIRVGAATSIRAIKGEHEYKAAELSDGERNALFLSCNVVCAKPGTLFFIDEPEQHLHPTIAAPLLTAMMTERSDCAFIISTHDIPLVEAVPNKRTVVVYGCHWEKNKDIPIAWKYNLIDYSNKGITDDSNEDIPDSIKRIILGGRNRILFVEGDEISSLDRRLYEAICPDFTIYPIGGVSGVISAVKSIRSLKSVHRVDAYGLVDNDGRSQSEIDDLGKQNVFVLQVYSIESLLYGLDARTIIARMKANELGRNAKSMLSKAKSDALSVIGKKKEFLAAKKCELQVRRIALENLPNVKRIMADHDKNIEISFSSPYSKELSKIKRLLGQKNIDALIAQYPVKNSGALKAISAAFNYIDQDSYESAVLQKIRYDKKLRQKIASKLPNQLINEES